MSGGSFVDPAQEAMKAKHADLEAAVGACNGAVERMQRKHQVQPNPTDVQLARLSMLFDVLLPAHVDGKEHDPDEPPTNPERLEFEIEFHKQMEQIIVEQMKAMDAAKAGVPEKRLHVPGRGNGMRGMR